MSQTVIGFFDDATDAQRAVERLESKGISRDRVDVSTGGSRSTDLSDSSTSNVDYDRSDRDSDRHENGITRFFKNLFGDDDDEADRYSRVASNSNTIVTVHASTDEEAEDAADILDDCGAVDVDERASQYGYSNTRNTEGLGDRTNISGDRSNLSDDRSSLSDDRSNISGDRDQTIERMEENLEIGKRTVERGGVRVRSRIVERPVEESIRLREEHVRVERNPVDRPISDGDMNRLQDQDIEMRERAEVPVVNKEARVVEEINLSKEVEEREETIRDNVRHTEVDVDKLDRGTTDRNRLDTDTDYDDDTRRGRDL